MPDLLAYVAEGVTHVSLGILVVLTAAIVHGAAVGVVYGTTAGALVVLAGLTALTGARTPVVWFRVCPFVLTGSAALLLAAALL